MDRTTLITGPALVTHNGGSFFSKDDIQPKISAVTMKITDSAHGEVDEREIEAEVEVSITPDGRWEPATVAALWPYANSIIGASIYGATDLPLVMSGGENTNNGEIHTIIAAGITKMPSLTLSSTKTLVGAATWRGIRGKGLAWTAPNSLYSIATSGGSVADSDYDPAKIKTQAYHATWGAYSGWANFDTQDGWAIEFDMQLEPIHVDSIGVIDYRFKSLSVMARAIPVGPTATQVLTNTIIQNTGAGRGRSLRIDATGSITADLVITGADGINYCTVKAAGIKTQGYRFGATVLRQGEVGFVAARTFSAGLQNPLFILATS